jgi:hypothetical protein
MTLFTKMNGQNLARERFGITAICVAAMSFFVLMFMAKIVINYIDLSLTAIRFPFELDYGEGIVWQQAVMIPSESMYGDITRYPFIVFHYPPIYHLILHFLISLHAPPLIAGRSLSFAASLTIALCAAAITHHTLQETSSRPGRAIGTAVTFVAALAPWPFEVWSTLMRVDMLSIAFCFLGLLCCLRSVSRPWLLYLAVVFFVCGAFTKQTSILAPLSVLPAMWAIAPARAWRGVMLGLVLGFAAFALLEIVTSGGFLRHVLFYNINRFSIRAFLSSSRSAPYHAIFLCLAIWGLIEGWRSLHSCSQARNWPTLRAVLKTNPVARTVLTITIYFVLTTLSLMALAKSGSSFNYLVEWMEVWSIPIGLVISWKTAPIFVATAHATSRYAAAFVALALLGVQFAIIPNTWNPILTDRPLQHDWAELAQLLRSTPLPILSDDMVLLREAGHQVVWEPAIFAELASDGQWDEQLIIRLIDAKAFGLIVTDGSKGDFGYDSRYTPRVNKAIETNYSRIKVIGGYNVRRPAD